MYVDKRDPSFLGQAILDTRLEHPELSVVQVYDLVIDRMPIPDYEDEDALRRYQDRSTIPASEV